MRKDYYGEDFQNGHTQVRMCNLKESDMRTELKTTSALLPHSTRREGGVSDFFVISRFSDI